MSETPRRVLYVLKRYPRLSETFVVREILGVEAAGVTVLVDAMLAPEDEPRHAELARVVAAVRYLPRSPRVLSREVAGALLRRSLARPGHLLGEALAARRRARSGLPRAARHFLLSVMVADRVVRERVEHLHCHFATGAVEVMVPAARMAGVPCSVTAHAKDIFHAENRDHLARRVAGTDAVVTVSAYNVAHLHRVLPSPGPRLRHVPNGVPVGPATADAVGDPDAPVLCVSRLVAKKGIDTLAHAIALAARTDARLRLEVVGEGPLRPDLEALVDDLGLADRVRFLGALPSSEVERAYARCGLVALPCRVDASGDRDGLPTVLVEALGRGVPVVSTRLVGIPELVRDGETGLLVEPDDPASLAVALTKLREDPAWARSLGARGRRLVAERYDPSAATRRLLDVWTEAGR